MKKIFVSGCYDIIHAGHIQFFNEAKALGEHLPEVKVRVAAIFRKGKAIIPSGNTVIEAKDEIFVIADVEKPHC